ncbi:MAG: hypothetical protein VBE63_15275 [Lamprobacter sp.]|uniref:hypothetical protein n=1 Tax=Lamprobacter sp. TaxID=3100796 RepID=UPI002B26002F|nr:hypothetical protein [Lamprobacter sp.]MEA3641285.1 hypothetical protein [Lamprobacter sp.]
MNIFNVDQWFFDGMTGEDPDLSLADDDIYLAAFNAGRRKAGLAPITDGSQGVTPAGCASRLDSEHPANFRADA